MEILRADFLHTYAQSGLRLRQKKTCENFRNIDFAKDFLFFRNCEFY